MYAIYQLVRIFVKFSARMHDFIECRDFCESLGRTHDCIEVLESCESPHCTHRFCESPGCTHRFCEFCMSPGCTHDFCEAHVPTHHFCATRTHDFTDLCRITASTAPLTSDTIFVLTKWTPPLLTSGSCVSPTLFYEMCFDSVFTQVTDAQDWFRHIYHMEIVWFRLTPTSQPSFSVVLKRSSVYTSGSY